MIVTRPTHLIGIHLHAYIANIAVFDGYCAICNEKNGEGLPVDKVITKTFADVEWLTGGRYICQLCLRCLGQGQPRAKWIKNFSSISTEKTLVILKREDLWKYLMNPPKGTFVFNITFSHKKHMSFKSRVNTGGSPYWVTTDQATVLIDLDEMSEAIKIMQSWYSRIEKGKDRTWFTKAEILLGPANTLKIMQYGTAKWTEENRILTRLRGSHNLEVLVHALNKGDASDQD